MALIPLYFQPLDTISASILRSRATFWLRFTVNTISHDNKPHLLSQVDRKNFPPLLVKVIVQPYQLTTPSLHLRYSREYVACIVSNNALHDHLISTDKKDLTPT